MSSLPTLSGHDLAVLQSRALGIPQARRLRNVARQLEETFDAFLDHFDELTGPLRELVRTRRERIGELADSLVDTWHRASEGDVDAALESLDAGIGRVRGELVSMSRRHSKKVLPGQSLYRLAAWEGVSRREHMFHSPFELPQLGYRFSQPGAPCLYLANSVYLCWLECGRPRLDHCFVSRFEIDSRGFDHLDVPASSAAYLAPLDVPSIPGLMIDPRAVMNSPYDEDVVAEIAEYLTVWPLLAASTLRRKSLTPGAWPEYVIPQLLMRWVRESDSIIGIRYFTSKDERSTNSQDWALNLALPTRSRKQSGYCDFLRAHARWTEPQPLAAMRRLTPRDLATAAAVDERERRSGRVMLHQGRSLRPYFETTFGKMEYWLDRPELELATLQS